MSADAIDPFLFEYEGPLPTGDLLTYVMPPAAYEALKAAQEKQPSHNADIRGLEAVLAWAAPGVDICGIAPVEPGQPGRSLQLLCYAPQSPFEQVRQEVDNALALWIGLAVPPEHSEKIHRMLQDGRTAKTAWRTSQIGMEVFQQGACPVPRDGRLFDLLSVAASRALEGLALPGTSGDRRLLATGPGESLYSGKMLVGFHPHAVERASGDVRGHWTELMRVAAMSTPEQRHLRVAVAVSIRNYLPIHPASFKPDGSRTLDVFLQPDLFLSQQSKRTRALSIPIQRRDLHALSDASATSASPALAVLRRILALSDVSEQALIDARGQLVAHFGRKASLMPTAGSYHGDRWLPGQTGVGAPDRESYLDLIRGPLEAAGFRAVRVHRRAPPRLKSLSPVEDAKNPQELLQKLVLQQLRLLNGEDTLHVALLSPRLQAHNEIAAALTDLLGAAEVQSERRSEFASGLKVDLHCVEAGPFATRLPDAAVAAAEEIAAQNIPKARQAQVERECARAIGKARTLEMQGHLDRVLPKSKGVWLCVLEMDTRLRDEPAQDPYLLAYRVLAQRNILPQVVLFDPDQTVREDEDEGDATHKLRSALRDLLRALGVVYVDPASCPQGMQLEGWFVANFNANLFDRRPGARRDRLVLPMAVRFANGTLLASVPGADRTSPWQPYAKALLALYAGDFQDTQDLRRDALQASVGQFFASLLNEGGSNITFCDATNIRQYLPALGNGKLRFGELAVGQVGGAAVVATARDGESRTIVRLLLDPDKSPTYHVPGNASGITTGTFAEPGATRTFWLSRGLPTALQTSVAIRTANRSSRYDENKRNLKARRFPSLTEVCIPVLGADQQADQVMALTRRAMLLHASTDEATILPCPLHEARLLAEALR
ncbi:MAG TPA: RNaseH domain-containing protein [Albitalea sp.]|uniref:RNaseH domain-containing protein n=1 Tax=Piscinibacter sp. TaxID=1903157 RepID=UPI002ED21A1E